MKPEPVHLGHATPGIMGYCPRRFAVAGYGTHVYAGSQRGDYGHWSGLGSLEGAKRYDLRGRMSFDQAYGLACQIVEDFERDILANATQAIAAGLLEHSDGNCRDVHLPPSAPVDVGDAYTASVMRALVVAKEGNVHGALRSLVQALVFEVGRSDVSVLLQSTDPSCKGVYRMHTGDPAPFAQEAA